VNKLLALYKGTRNFHNFTSGKLADDKSANRFVMNSQCGPPFEMEGMEFCVISVRGQSFMLHQIRKMIGLVIAVVKGVTDSSCITGKVWGPIK
jgi:tRNA pseudouridine38-40 synthase